jgi:membrane protease YdiL (CAAX protease family)
LDICIGRRSTPGKKGLTWFLIVWKNGIHPGQNSVSALRDDRTRQKERLARGGLFFLFVVIGLLTFLVFSHFRPLLLRPTFPWNVDIPARIVFIVALLLSSLLLRRSERLHRYWPVLFAFFSAALAQALDYYLSGWSLSLLRLDVAAPAGIAVDKLESTFLIVVPIIVLTKLSGNSMGSIYLQKGSLKWGLIIGLTVFAVVAAVSIPWAKFQYQTTDLSLQRVIPWVPWILLFVLANGFNEELLFRGLFLKKLEPLLGAFPANLCMAIPFVALHYGVDYTQNLFLLMGLLLPLGLALGYVMQRTNSILASWLIHASFDIAVVLALFSGL